MTELVIKLVAFVVVILLSWYLGGRLREAREKTDDHDNHHGQVL